MSEINVAETGVQVNGEFAIDKVEMYIITLKCDTEAILPKTLSSISRKPLSSTLFTSNVLMLENAKYIASCDWPRLCAFIHFYC